jgi:hypothetical protein
LNVSVALARALVGLRRVLDLDQVEARGGGRGWRPPGSPATIRWHHRAIDPVTRRIAADQDVAVELFHAAQRELIGNAIHVGNRQRRVPGAEQVDGPRITPSWFGSAPSRRVV